jgi:hypothetical protein
MEPVPKENLIIFRLSVSQYGGGIINPSTRLSDEEKVPGGQIIVRPRRRSCSRARETCPKRLIDHGRRSRGGRHAHDAVDDRSRRGSSPCTQKKTDYARPLISPNAIRAPHTKVPSL